MSDEEGNEDSDMNISGHDTCMDRVHVKRRRQFLIRFRRKRRRLIFFVILGLASFAVAASIWPTKLYGNGNSRSVASSGSPRRAHLRRGNIPTYKVPFNEGSVASNAIHLIMVAGHSVLIGNNVEDAASDESVWHLLDYQRGQGLPQAIVAHIAAGIAEASRDPRSLLVFSGGETRADGTGPYSEGSSYFRVADALHLWETDNEEVGEDNAERGMSVRARTVTEEFATDSFENLLFSICRFKEVTGKYPQFITLVSFTFKEQRFVELHASALRWPSSHLKYIGKDAPSSTGFDLERARKGEQDNAVQHFLFDPYGCHSPELKEKRNLRNPFKRRAPYELTCPEMKDLLKWCGPELFSQKNVPWRNLNT